VCVRAKCELKSESVDSLIDDGHLSALHCSRINMPFLVKNILLRQVELQGQGSTDRRLHFSLANRYSLHAPRTADTLVSDQ